VDEVGGLTLTRGQWLPSRRIVLSGLLAALGTACGRSDESEPGRLTFSASLAEDELPTVRGVLERFRGETGIAVRLVAVTAADLPEKLKVEVGAGRPTIDLFAQDNLALRALVDGGLVQPLDDVAVPDAVLPVMVPPRFDSTRYFLPFRPNVLVTYANRARFREAGVAPPRTAAELRAVAEAFKGRRGAPKVTLALAEGAPAAITVAELVLGFGGDPLVLNDRGSVAAFEFLAALWRDGLLARESLVAKYDTQVDHLVSETAWLAQNWPFTSGVLARQDLLDRFEVYEGWRGPARAVHVVGGDVLGIPRGITGRRRERAIRLATFLMSRGAQERLVAGNAWPAIRGDAYGQVPVAQRETFEAVRLALASGWHRPGVPYWSDASDAMNDAVRRILQGGEPVRSVLDRVHGAIAEAARRKGAPYPPPR
jgi:trehalose transport system substrate-binding protein